MQVLTDYTNNPYLNYVSSQKASPAAVLPRSDEARGTESLEYRAFLRKASTLLSNPGLSTLERTQILNLMARGQSAAENAAMGELTAIFYEINRFEPGQAAGNASLEQGASAARETTDTQEQAKVTYKDQSGDPNVSFKYPVALNEYQAPLAVMAHEGQHVILARAEALRNNEDVTAYISYNYGYDNNGRLIITGGTTTVITRAGYEAESCRIGGNIDIYV